MAETRLARTGTPFYSTGGDTQLSRADWNEFAQDVINGTMAMYAQGLRAARPAAGKQGRHYLATDTGPGLYYDNGSTWLTLQELVSLVPDLAAGASVAWDSGSAFVQRAGSSMVTLTGMLFSGAQVGTSGFQVTLAGTPAPLYGAGVKTPPGSFVYNGQFAYGVWDAAGFWRLRFASTEDQIIGPIPVGTSLQLQATYRAA